MRQSIFTLLLFAIAFSSHSQVRTFDFNPKQIINTENIEIVRDEYGVPHIFGKTDAEVAYGLEWATCEDDFETLQYLLMAAKCYLGIHLGVEGARIDYAVQAMGLHEFVEQNYESGVADDFKLILEAACQGVNAYAAAHPEEVWVKSNPPISEALFQVYQKIIVTPCFAASSYVGFTYEGASASGITGPMRL